MSKYLKVLAALVPCLLASSCTNSMPPPRPLPPPQPRFANKVDPGVVAVQSWVGSKVSDAIDTLGPPSRRTKSNNSTVFYRWNMTGPEGSKCEVYMWTNAKGVVKRAEVTGDKEATLFLRGKHSPKLEFDIPRKTYTGTGFFVSGDGHILTAFHVVEDAEKITVTTSDGAEYQAEVLNYSKANDLAVLKIQAIDLTFLPLKTTRKLNPGLDIFTMGFPVTGILGDEIKYSDGSIASMSGLEGEQSLLQMTVPIQPGNSGGPLVTEDGHAVGIVTSTAAIKPFLRSTGAIPQNVNWAVKSDYAMLLYDQIEMPPPVSKDEAIKRTKAATCRITTALK